MVIRHWRLRPDLQHRRCRSALLAPTSWRSWWPPSPRRTWNRDQYPGASGAALDTHKASGIHFLHLPGDLRGAVLRPHRPPRPAPWRRRRQGAASTWTSARSASPSWPAGFMALLALVNLRGAPESVKLNARSPSSSSPAC
ncbi:hypothetical protein QJS66_14640 [Kocuria rhizophila]|nr:hypothetical protein QJS66_14640 [Kocuria rhizophila]